MTFTAKITNTERLINSTNGNPRFRVMFDNGTIAVTETDAQLGYLIGNPGLGIGDTVWVSTSASGAITHMRPVAPS
jgi:hypothetical protein